MIQMASMKIVQFSRPPTSLSIYVKNSSTPFTLDVQVQTNLPFFLQMITIQLKENIMQRWLLHVIRSFLQVGFRFQYQPINLVWLSFDFFSFSWSLTICFFVALYSCVELSKNTMKCLLFIIIHIFITHFAINLFYLYNLKT